jgi:hypothetical protein
MSILPRKGILAVAAVIEIALSAQPMAGKTWRRGKDWRYDIWSRCYRCSHPTASSQDIGGRVVVIDWPANPATSVSRIFCAVAAAWRTIRRDRCCRLATAE